MKQAAQFGFYRTLYSQSAASLTVSTTAGAVRQQGRSARLTLLAKGDHLNASVLESERPAQASESTLFLKVNFQDAAESLPLADALSQHELYRAVILFGIFAAGNASAILERYPRIDGVVLGEPENVVPRVLAAIDEGLPLATISGLLTSGAPVRLTSERREASPVQQDVITLDEIKPVRDVEAREPGRLANIESNRGCIATCSFCHVPVVEQRFGAPRRRLRAVDRVIEDVEDLVALGKRYFIFNDPVFWGGGSDTERVVELAERLGAIRPRVQFMVYLRLAPFPDEELLAILARNGLIRVFIGVESDSSETLKLYRKGAIGPGYADIRDLLDRYGVSHHIGFLTFNPFSSLGQIRHDVDFLDKHDQLHRIGVVLERTRLVPGTSLGARAQKEGLVTGDRDPLSCDAAYSWRFADEKVGTLHSHLQRVLVRGFGGRAKYLEYYHTSAGLLQYMVERDKEGQLEVERLWGPLKQLRTELALTLRDFYMQAIDQASQTAAGANHASDDIFLASLTRLFARTQVAYAALLAEVREAGHGEAIESLFTSKEGY